MKNFLYFVLILIFLSSCKETPETKFKKDGISLTCPKGWAITEEEKVDDGYYLAIEKDGIYSSGIVTISWANNDVDLSVWLELIKQEFVSNPVYKNSDLEFSENFETNYNGINSISVKFTATILKLKHEGMLHVFNKNGKSVFVLEQVAVDDKIKNKNGFKIIEQSFKLE